MPKVGLILIKYLNIFMESTLWNVFLAFITTAVGVVAMTIIVYYLSTFLTYLTFERKSIKGDTIMDDRKKSFYSLIDSAFEKGMIKDKSDIEIFFDTINRDTLPDFQLGPILEDYYSHIALRSMDSEKSRCADLILLKEVINGENEKSPFINLPDEERRLLTSIKQTIKDQGEVANMNLQALCDIISSKSKMYDDGIKSNKKARIYNIISIIVTTISLFFGLFTLIYQKV